MEPTINISTKAEILEALQNSMNKISDTIHAISNEDFIKVPTDKWSIQEELEHLVISTEAVLKALSMPRIALRAFGKLNREPRSYAQLVQRYNEKLQEGAVATGRFTPKGAKEKYKLLTEWDNFYHTYEDKLQAWSEKALDKYLLPHPLLGKLTIREMLFFTNHHILHHLQSIEHKRG